MKDALSRLNKVFENRYRLGVMSMLMVNERVHYSMIKKALNISDGNLASHIKTLKKAEYIADKKEFLNNKPHTTYQVTSKGKAAFEDHLNALEELLKGMEE